MYFNSLRKSSFMLLSFSFSLVPLLPSHLLLLSAGFRHLQLSFIALKVPLRSKLCGHCNSIGDFVIFLNICLKQLFQTNDFQGKFDPVNLNTTAFIH